MKNNFEEQNRIEQWVEAAEGIKEDFGLDKALGYVIGEKFYNLVKNRQYLKRIVRDIDEKRKSPDYNPFKTVGEGKYKQTINLDEDYKNCKKRIISLQEGLIEFAELIKSSFEPYEIRKYFNSNPRLGALGHVSSEEEHKVFVQQGAVEHSMDTEVEDALTFGEMMEYFDCSSV